MATLNERMRDLAVAQQIDTLSVAEGEADRLLVILRQIDRDLESRLRRIADPGGATAARLAIIRRDVRSAIDRTHDKVRDDLKGFIGEFAQDTAATETGAFERALTPIGVEFTMPRFAALITAIRSTPMNGTPLADWIQRLRRNDFERTWNTILRGVTIGQTNEEIIRAVVGSGRLRFKDGVREVSRRGLRTLVRTATIHAATQAREAVWNANADLIRGVQWVSTLDSRTSAICQALDNRVFPVGKGPRPPIHPNCRSVVTPILKGWRALGARGLDAETRASIDGQVPADLKYEDWLKRRSAKFQDGVLGPTRGKLFRQGGLSLDKFVDDRGRRLTLPELRLRVPGAFDEAGL